MFYVDGIVIFMLKLIPVSYGYSFDLTSLKHSLTTSYLSIYPVMYRFIADTHNALKSYYKTGPPPKKIYIYKNEAQR